MSRYVEVCHCGHDKATHFEGKHTCLGMGCDPECRKYRDRDGPILPNHASDCLCLLCRPSSAYSPVETPTPVIHSPWCTCDECLRRMFP